MCTLNARSYIRSTGEEYNTATSHIFASRDIPTMGATRITGGISIHVDTTQRYDNDRDFEKGVAEEVEMSPVGKSSASGGRDDRSSDEIEHVGFFPIVLVFVGLIANVILLGTWR